MGCWRWMDNYSCSFIQLYGPAVSRCCWSCVVAARITVPCHQPQNVFPLLLLPSCHDAIKPSRDPNEKHAVSASCPIQGACCTLHAALDSKREGKGGDIPPRLVSPLTPLISLIRSSHQSTSHIPHFTLLVILSQLPSHLSLTSRPNKEESQKRSGDAAGPARPLPLLPPRPPRRHLILLRRILSRGRPCLCQATALHSHPTSRSQSQRPAQSRFNFPSPLHLPLDPSPRLDLYLLHLSLHEGPSTKDEATSGGGIVHTLNLNLNPNLDPFPIPIRRPSYHSPQSQPPSRLPLSLARPLYLSKKKRSSPKWPVHHVCSSCRAEAPKLSCSCLYPTM